jgi:hypothetical protein
MTADDIAIATISLARDEAEERLLTRALTALDAHGIPMLIADGGSPEHFVGTLRSLRSATLVEPDGRGLVAQVKTSVRAAAATGVRHVLYTEPDKLDFFERHLAAFLAAIPSNAGVAIAARAPAAFATFPIMQHTTETAINAVVAELTGREGDYGYGPFVLDASLARHFDIIPDDLGWGWRFAIFVAAHRAGLRVDLVDGMFECPVDQRDESERDRLYRITQLEQNVRGVLIGGSADP